MTTDHYTPYDYRPLLKDRSFDVLSAQELNDLRLHLCSETYDTTILPDGRAYLGLGGPFCHLILPHPREIPQLLARPGGKRQLLRDAYGTDNPHHLFAAARRAAQPKPPTPTQALSLDDLRKGAQQDF